MPDLDNLISRLVCSKVDFVVIGGFAAFAHGAALQTQDIDVCCDFSANNLARLHSALSDLHPVHRMSPQRPPFESTPESSRGFKNLYLDTDYGQLDCLGSVEGVGGFEQVKQNSIEVELSQGTCRILSLEALIRSKEVMGRPRDREAVLQLKAICEHLRQK